MAYRAGRFTLACVLLLLAGVLVGCSAEGSAASGVVETSPPPTRPTQVMGTAEGLPSDAPPRLVSRRVDAAPTVDGDLDARWQNAAPLELPLILGAGGEEVALPLELRSVHTDQLVCFAAQWSDQPPSGHRDTTFNKLTMHWRIPPPQGTSTGHLDCTVVCHTAFADGRGRISYMIAETIPQGSAAPLQSAGRWESGIWTIEWCRPLHSDNPYDLQFTALDVLYPFRMKVFERVEGRRDPVSGFALLAFDT